jgi:hypothetical protein
MQPLLMWKSNNYKNSECLLVAFETQYTILMHRFILSSVTCLAVTYFPTLPVKWQDFLEKYSKTE